MTRSRRISLLLESLELRTNFKMKWSPVSETSEKLESTCGCSLETKERLPERSEHHVASSREITSQSFWSKRTKQTFWRSSGRSPPSLRTKKLTLDSWQLVAYCLKSSTTKKLLNYSIKYTR